MKDKIILTKSIDRIISLNETGVAYKNSELNLFDRSGTKTINNKDKVDTRLIPGEDQIKYIGFTLSKIKDNGIGIAAKNIKRLFERFYRVDKSRSREQGGTGLGLAIVKHIIEAHEQKIQVKSTIDKGTQFLFSLNLHKS